MAVTIKFHKKVDFSADFTRIINFSYIVFRVRAQNLTVVSQ